MTVINQSENLSLGYSGWKSYNSIKKKAMEQEFSWTGLILSLAIAFFIVLISAQGLSMLYQASLDEARGNYFSGKKIYRLENKKWLNEQSLIKRYDLTEKITNNYLEPISKMIS